jgi:sugar lactone lactonase YvrE
MLCLKRSKIASRFFVAAITLGIVTAPGALAYHRAVDAQGQTLPAPTTVIIAGSDTAGFEDGPGGVGGTASFNRPNGLAYDHLGNLYVADTSNHAIRKIDGSGNVTTMAGTGTAGFTDGSGGRNGAATFNKPTGIVSDQKGNLYVSDTANHAIRKIDANGNVTTIAGNGKPGLVDGNVTTSARAPLFNTPGNIVLDSKGDLLLADSGRIRKIDSAGNVTSLKTTPGIVSPDDSWGLAIDSADFLYTFGQLVLGGTYLKKLDPKGKTVASWDFRMGPSTSADGRIPVFRGFDLHALALDRDGNLFATARFDIRKVAPDGYAFDAGSPSTYRGGASAIAFSLTNGFTATDFNKIVRYDNPQSAPLPPDHVVYDPARGTPKPTVPTTTTPITLPEVPRVCRIRDELNVPPRSKTTSFSSHLQDQTILLLKLLKSLQRELPQAIKRDWATLIREEANLLNGVSKLNRQKLAQPIRDELAYDLVFRHSERLKSEPFVKRLNEWFRTTCKAFGEDSLPI